jgi:hypothetical protein
MKYRIVSFILFVCVGVVLARNITYNHSKPPKLPLGSAYGIAMSALGQSTNDFHCVGASLGIAWSPDGEWLFEFSSTNGVTKFVTVEFGGKTHIEKAPLTRT